MIKTNKQFIHAYQNYADANEQIINSGEKPLLWSKYHTSDNFEICAALISIFPCMFFSVFFVSFASLNKFFVPLFFIVSMTMALSSIKSIKSFCYLLSQNMRAENKIEKFIFTGNLEDIFNSDDDFVKTSLKNKKNNLLNDIQKLNGVRGTTILEIYNNALLQKYFFLKEKRIEKEKENKIISLSDNCQKMASEIQSIYDFRHLQHYEEAIADSEKDLNRIEKLLENIPKSLTNEEKNKLHSQYMNELKDRNIHLEKMRMEAQKRIDAKKHFYESQGI